MKSFISKLFNITAHEWPRTITALLLKILIQMTYIMGWTLIVSIFVIKVGLHDLPVLFVVNAFLIILGSSLFSFVVHKYGKEKLMMWTALLGVIIFLASRMLFDTNLYFFIFVFLIAESAILSQLNILMVLFMEEIFTPLEAQRTAPFIESAEPLGGILGGIFITFLASYFAVANLVYALPPFLLLFIAIIYFYLKKVESIPRLKTKEEHEEHSTMKKMGRVKAGMTHLKGIPFLKTLLILVLCQWMFFTLVEYQYTTYVHHAVTHDDTHAEDILHEEGDKNHVNGDKEHKDNDNYETDEDHAFIQKAIAAHPVKDPSEITTHVETEEEIHAQEAIHETDLTKGLGMLHILFSILVLLSRVFIHARIFERIGLAKSSLFYPIGSMFGVLYALITPGFASAVFLKADTEITGAIHIDAYHNSYYGLKEAVADQTKEFMEGVIRPLGLIIGTAGLFALQALFHDEETLVRTINILSIVILCIMMFVMYYRHQYNYTRVSKRNLDRHGDHPIKFTALEVLSQKGHKNAAEILVKNLMYKKESVAMRKKVLQVLANLQDYSTIPVIIKSFEDPSDSVKLEAVKALGKFYGLGKHLKSRSFSKYRVIEALKELFIETKSKKIKSEVINVFKNINHHEVIPFLLEVLESGDDELKADCIYVCGLFKDISVAHYIEKYLDSKNPHVKASAIIALWSFVRYRIKLLAHVLSLIESNKREDILAGIYTLGETQSIQEIPRLMKYLKSDDLELKQHAAVALAKMKQHHAVEHIIYFLLHEDRELAFKTQDLLRNVHPEMEKKIFNRLKQEVSHKIAKILRGVKTNVLEELEEHVFEQLRDAYKLIKDEKEVLKIEKILEAKQKEKAKKS